MLLTCAAGAANAGTIDNGYPGDTEAQAQMLCDLGLFRGTESGFELEKPMTRAEAAAMLTRLLGAEQEALTAEREHPFTDVPDWADPYVGWLFRNGRTQGGSETRYGAEEDVTFGQYCTFLARASSDNDSYTSLVREGEEEACDAAGFVRGDAVSMSTRLLRETYWKNGSKEGKSVAQGDTAQLTDITLEGDWELRPWTDGQLLLGMTQGWLLTEERVQPMAIHGSVFTERAGGVLVTQSITAERTEVCTWTPDGQPIDAVTVPNDVPVSPGQSESLRLFYAPDLSNYDEEYLWGGVGLYQEQDGRLTRITARPAFDYARDPADGSYVIVTHAPGRLIQYEEGAVVYRTGDTLVRLLPDGTEQPLLPALPEGSLLIDTVHILPDGRVEFTTMRPTEPHKMGRLTCVLEGGKVTVTDATADIFYMLGEDSVEREQARLDALGIGVNAP